MAGDSCDMCVRGVWCASKPRVTGEWLLGHSTLLPLGITMEVQIPCDYIQSSEGLLGDGNDMERANPDGSVITSWGCSPT